MIKENKIFKTKTFIAGKDINQWDYLKIDKKKSNIAYPITIKLNGKNVHFNILNLVVLNIIPMPKEKIEAIAIEEVKKGEKFQLIEF